MLLIGLFASTARVNETVAMVVTAAKSFCGSYDSCLKSDGARFTVELTGVIRIVSPSGLDLATNSLATMPCAPGLFSTITGLPASRESWSL